MIRKVFSIRDSKSELFGTPFFNITHGEAERNFKTLVNDPKSSVSVYPEDFDLYYLGTYDDITGKVVPIDSPEHLVKAVNVVAAKQ